MKFLKILGIGILILLALGLWVVALTPGFMLMEMFLGMEPVIICAALLILGFAMSFVIKNPYLEKIFGYLLLALGIGVIIYYVIAAIGISIPLWIILLVIGTIVLNIFLTSVLKNVPFIGAKIIPPMWLISIFIVFMIIFRFTVATE